MGHPRRRWRRVTVLCCPEPTGTEDGEPLGSGSGDRSPLLGLVRGGHTCGHGRLTEMCYLLVESLKTEELTFGVRTCPGRTHCVALCL